MTKLLVIGNGFDLQLGLESSFYDFFESQIFQKRSNYKEPYYNNREFDAESYIRSFEGASKKDRLANIKAITEYPFRYDFQAERYAEIKMKANKDSQVNFWAVYFRILKHFPNYHNENDVFKTSINSSIGLERWADVEYQIYKLLRNSESIIDKYVNCVEVGSESSFNSDNTDLNTVIEKYENSYFNGEDITYIGVLNLMTVSISLVCGWKPKIDDFYNFLFEELKNFENIFSQYLQLTVNNHPNYVNDAEQFARDLAGNYDYDLINFNYTSFYNLNNPHRVNIHSTLSSNGNGHPIFGITSYTDNNTNEDDLIANRTYYRFTKVYRIMSQAKNNINKQILPSNADEIIFYGHSFAQADYSYFDAIFDHYHIYDDSRDVRLTFKFSNYIDKLSKMETNTEPNQINVVYKLINQFAERIGKSNLLQKLLLENRISVIKVVRDKD